MKKLTFLRSMFVLSALLVTGLGYAQVKKAVPLAGIPLETQEFNSFTLNKSNKDNAISLKKVARTDLKGEYVSLLYETFGNLEIEGDSIDALNYEGYDCLNYINSIAGTIIQNSIKSNNYLCLHPIEDDYLKGYLIYGDLPLRGHQYIKVKFNSSAPIPSDSIMEVGLRFWNTNNEYVGGYNLLCPSKGYNEFGLYSFVFSIDDFPQETSFIQLYNPSKEYNILLDNIEILIFDPNPDFYSYVVSTNSEFLNIENSSNYPWKICTYNIDNQYQMRGVISTNHGVSNSVSWFSTSVSSADSYIDLSYMWKVNAGNTNDKLILYVNGMEHTSISGDTPLQVETYQFEPGNYSFVWAYEKSMEEGSTGDDKGFVSNVKVAYTPMVTSAELFKETFGKTSAASKINIDSYTGYDNLTAGVVYKAIEAATGGDIRSVASDTIHKNHLWLPAKSNSGILIGGLESFVSGHSNLRLSFEIAVQSATTLNLNVIANGTDIIQFPETVFTESNKYQTIKCSNYLPSNLSNLELSVTADMATVAYRIDNITITEEKKDDTPEVMAPVLHVDKSLINFKYVATPNQGNESVYITNVGNENLVINEIKGVSAPFSYTALASKTLPQYMGNEMYFQFAPAATDKGIFRQTATILSNGGELEIVLQGYANMNNVVETADYGQLSTVVMDPSVDSLIVIGYLNENDFYFMRDLMPNLKYLDISMVTLLDNRIPNSGFAEKQTLEEIILPKSLQVFGSYAFQNCTALKTINFSEGITVINNRAFENCTSLTGELILPSTLTNIEYYAFKGCSYTVCKSKAVIPPSLEDKNSFANISLVYVPKGSAQLYRGNYPWGEMTIIDGDTITEVSVTLIEAGTLGNEILKQAESVAVVNKLTVVGPMNIDDWNLIKNSMSALLSIDLSASTVTSIPKSQFADKKSLLEVVLPSKLETIEYDAFLRCSKLVNIVIPETVVNIGDNAFHGCSSLRSINIPESLRSLGSAAFYQCSVLNSPIIIPEGMTEIPSNAFYYCQALTEVSLPESLLKISSNVFKDCAISTIVLPEQLTTVEYDAFLNCPLEEIILPATLTSIGDYAFSCTSLKKITCNQATPPILSSDPFSNVDKTTCELSVPTWSVDMYKLAKYWMNFSNITTYDAAVDHLPISGVFTMADGIRPQGTPSITVQKGATLIVRGEQPFATNKFVMKHKLYNSWGTDFSSCVFANLMNESPEMTAESAIINFEVNGNKWFFLSFPYDINYSGITVDEGKFFVFRKYDGASRASKGVSTATGDSWKNMESSEVLKAGNGYIFQCNEAVTNLTLKATIESKNQLFANTMRSIALNDYIPADGNTENQSWNLVGNPFPSYFDINSLEYVTPITIWNGSSYEALSPVDDEYVLRPFEAFFVQKPTDVASIKFNPHGRRYKTSSSNKVAPKQVAANSERKVFNFVIGKENGEDKCRIVINPKAKADYEMTCDAAKFMSLEADVPQIYTIDRKGTMFAINERPEGNVLMGMYVAKAGDYTISLRTQVEGVDVFLLDRTTGEEINLSSQDYTFAASEGVDNDRFKVRFEYAGPTNIDSDKAVTVQVNSMKGALHVQAAAGSVVKVVNYTGLTVKNMSMAGSATVISLPQGAYVVIVNGKSYKAIVL